MKTSKGKVLKIDKKHVVVITKDGEFVRTNLPKHKVMVGDIIEFPNKKFIHYKSFKPHVAIAAILVIAISLGLFNIFMSPTAYASVAVDMTNSSIELTVDKQSKIVKAVAKSEQGNKILSGLDIEGMDIYSGVNLITNKAVNLGYFSPEEENLAMATVIPLQDKESQMLIDLERLMNTIRDEMFKNKYDGYVMVNEGNSQFVKEAHAKELSVNKYMLQKKTQEHNIHLSDEAIRHKSTTDIMKEYNLDVQNISPDNWCEVYENDHEITPPNNIQEPMKPKQPNEDHEREREDMQHSVPNNEQIIEYNPNNTHDNNRMYDNEKEHRNDQNDH